MKQTIDRLETFVVEHCCECGVAYAITRAFFDQKQSDKTDFYCPSGHGQHYTKSTAQKLREELATAKRDADHFKQSRDRALSDAKHFESRANGYKGQLALVKKRIANGVCPCRNRYFAALHQHMQNKHKEFLEETGLMQAMTEATSEGFDAAVNKACENISEQSAVTYRGVARKVRRFLFGEGNPEPPEGEK